MSLSFQGGGYQAAPDPRAREAGPAARQADARHQVLGETERAEEVEGDGGGAGQLRQPRHRGRQVRASRRPGDLFPPFQDPEAVARLHHQKVRAQEERRGADIYRNGNKLLRHV